MRICLLQTAAGFGCRWRVQRQLFLFHLVVADNANVEQGFHVVLVQFQNLAVGADTRLYFAEQNMSARLDGKRIYIVGIDGKQRIADGNHLGRIVARIVVFDKLQIPEDSELRRVVEIMNPLGEDYSIMRTLPLNGMLSSLATNYNRRNKNVRLYELANVYLPKELPLKELPEERMQFTLGMYGDGDFYSMKGVVEEFLEKAGLHEKESYDPAGNRPYLHPGRQANILYAGNVIGYLGEVHPDVADAYGIGERAYIAVLDMPEVTKYATFDRKYTGIAKYPAVTRDISMVMPKEILAGQVEEVIEAKGGAYLESYALFDVYEGAQIKAGYKSLAYSIVFRAKDKTLEDAEVTEAMERILKTLEGMGIELRK